MLALGGDIRAAYSLLLDSAEEVAAVEPDLAVMMLAEAVDAAYPTGDGERMRRAAERAVELSAGMGEGRAAAFAAIAHGMALVFAGEGAAGATSFRRAVDMIESGPALSQDPELAALTVSDLTCGLMERQLRNWGRRVGPADAAFALDVLCRTLATDPDC